MLTESIVGRYAPSKIVTTFEKLVLTLNGKDLVEILLSPELVVEGLLHLKVAWFVAFHTFLVFNN
jgi:hypothetical protein